MPKLLPEKPNFENDSERIVWQALKDQLPDDAVLIANLVFRETRSGPLEADLIVLWPMHGVAIIEVKGGNISIDGDGQIWQNDSQRRSIDPFDQAGNVKYHLHDLVERSSNIHRMRMREMVAFPHTFWNHDSAEHPRRAVIDKDDLPTAADRVRAALDAGSTTVSAPTSESINALLEVLRGRIVDPADLIEAGLLVDQRAGYLERLSQVQEELLENLRLLPSFEVRGAAGTGKTYLAMAQVRRLRGEGKRVGFFCYNRLLRLHVRREFEQWSKVLRPDVLETFHEFSQRWQPIPDGAPDHVWNEQAAKVLIEAGNRAAAETKFDAIVIDEAQDFRPLWWDAMRAWLVDPASGLFVFGDVDQSIFTGSGVDELNLPKIALNVNLRNPQPIAESTSRMISDPPRSMEYAGPPVTLVDCPADQAEAAADYMVDRLFDTWLPRNIVLMTTGRRHGEHAGRLETRGAEKYERGLWDDEEPFYTTVGKFKGLERPVAVIAVNGFHGDADPRDVLYVALSRATDAAVICGEARAIESVVGSSAMEKWVRVSLPPDM